MVVESTGYMPINLQALAPDMHRTYFDKISHFRTVVRAVDRAKPWQGYPSKSVRCWSAQRYIVNAVMRGREAPEAALERLGKETNALIKA